MDNLALKHKMLELKLKHGYVSMRQNWPFSYYYKRFDPVSRRMYFLLHFRSLCSYCRHSYLGFKPNFALLP